MNLLLIVYWCFVMIQLSGSQNVNIQKLLDSMTIEDKCGQMTQVTFDVIQKWPQPIDPDENPVNETKLLIALKDKKVGSILNTPYNVAYKASTWQKIIEIIQDVSLNQTSSKIPVLYGIDSIHGANYIREAVLFPQPLGMASTFNLEFAHKIGEITALETRVTGIPWNFNPVLDIGRQPLWPR
jgi:beta-glucosidase